MISEEHEKVIEQLTDWILDSGMVFPHESSPGFIYDYTQKFTGFLDLEGKIEVKEMVDYLVKGIAKLDSEDKDRILKFFEKLKFLDKIERLKTKELE